MEKTNQNLWLGNLVHKKCIRRSVDGKIVGKLLPSEQSIQKIGSSEGHKKKVLQKSTDYWQQVDVCSQPYMIMEL